MIVSPKITINKSKRMFSFIFTNMERRVRMFRFKADFTKIRIMLKRDFIFQRQIY